MVARRKNSSTPAVRTALAGDVLVALAKSAAALWTGSSAMTSEAIHSFVDAGNEILLLYGICRAGRRPDIEHPLGYGRELYFWSFIVALLVFALGAGFAVFEGINHVLHPEPIQHPLINYLVLGVAFGLEGWAWLVSFKQFDAASGDLGVYAAFRASKDPPSFMILFENSAALLGLIVAAIGTASAVAFHQPYLDGVASIVIGVILGGTAVLLARESKSLLIGERADPHLSHSILAIAAAEPFVTRANGLMTVQLSPDQILAALSLEFSDERTILQVEQQVIALEQHVRAAHPEVVVLFIKPQTDKTYSAQRRDRFGDPVEGAPKRRRSWPFRLRLPLLAPRSWLRRRRVPPMTSKGAVPAVEV
ncbi:cation transporter (plasmid) [Lichenicola cladoniae]|uniref:Cation transporter n=1 Tax=Lichenicola cladoniae TaxID=1484109 RepID=A0A6M8HZN4_9PROT|nr:cation diffusion facilitator family transporter [Lichenicola cladoniae]NPD69836.1 cation transporter [Acetobacteraceae bacterium]QKE93551.1 cation transporter [Lichenicola cladoniae]